jgi:uncharacterized Tic20 family protein
MSETEQQSIQADELAYAALGHFLQFTTWFLGPLILYLVKRESRFVAFHAMQALIWQMIYIAILVLSFVLFFGAFFASFPDAGESGTGQAGPPAAFFFFPLIWLFMMGGWVLTLVLGTVFGIKAIRGQWAEYPVIGKWARRIVGI